MDRIEELKQKLNSINDEMKALLDKIDEEDRDFTEDEQKKYDGLDKSLDEVKSEIEAEEKKAKERAERASRAQKLQEKVAAAASVTIPPTVGPTVEVVEPEDFKTMTEFVDAVMRKIFHREPDTRLGKWYSVTMNEPRFEKRVQSMMEGTAGGYMVPTQLMPGLKQVAEQKALIRPRATVLPAGDPPDAEITIPALDQSSNIFGGVDLTMTAEGATKTATEFKLKEVSLIPHELSGYIDVTDKLIRNWATCVSFVETMLKKALAGNEDYLFLRGTGVAQPHGIVNQNARLTVVRNTANSIVFADIRGMIPYLYAENGDNVVWFISPSGLESLLALADPGSAGTLIFQPSAREDVPNMLMGRPLFINQRCPALGTEGDLMLLNLSYYLIKDGSGPFIAASPHVGFKENRTCIKIVWNVDGDSWLQDEIPMEGDSTHNLSPFVILQ